MSEKGDYYDAAYYQGWKAEDCKEMHLSATEAKIIIARDLKEIEL